MPGMYLLKSLCLLICYKERQIPLNCFFQVTVHFWKKMLQKFKALICDRHTSNTNLSFPKPNRYLLHVPKSLSKMHLTVQSKMIALFPYTLNLLLHPCLFKASQWRKRGLKHILPPRLHHFPNCFLYSDHWFDIGITLEKLLWLFSPPLLKWHTYHSCSYVLVGHHHFQCKKEYFLNIFTHHSCSPKKQGCYQLNQEYHQL